jgi:hypothetical protein
VGYGRPTDFKAQQYGGRMSYEITVRFPDSITDFLNKLPGGDKCEFIRQAVKEKIERGGK